MNSAAQAAHPSQPHAHKFGGSSLADARCIAHVAEILQMQADPLVVVVSAMHGVTNALTALVGLAAQDAGWEASWQALCKKHLDAAAALDPEDLRQSAAWFRGEFAVLRERLHGIATAEQATPEDLAFVQGLGEVWSSRLVLLALGGEEAGWARMDAREVLVLRVGLMGPEVDWVATRPRLTEWRAAYPQRNVVITGFIGSDTQGTPMTLGRNGSDWSGAIFANLFDATDLTIWTDVDGILSADPRLVPDANLLKAMSYAEACELAYFGAKVLHPQTLAPAMQAGLPIRIRNTFNLAAEGTLIAAAPSGDATATSDSPVKGLTFISGLAMLELSGAGMIGVPGTAQRLFAALHAVDVSVTMITQGSSEHSICCVIPEAQAERARAAVQAEFAEAIERGEISAVSISNEIAVLAAVGDGMVGTPGVSAHLFRGLAQARVNIRAIAQGASERNISVAVDAADAARGLRAAHSAFWLSPATVSIGVIGPGNVGRALLAQFADALPKLAADPRLQRRLDLRVRAIANSRRMLLAPRRIDLSTVQAGLEDGEPFDIDAFVAHVRAEHLPHALIVDCSGSDAVASRYAEWLAMGIHIVTPSKHAGSGDLERFHAIRAAEHLGGQFRYEASVGAGLPVIQTLRGLLDTGDVLTGIEGILSGTLAWLFNRFDGSQPFSTLVLEAKALGYTEPDPRDDLSGLDVARKLVILAREAGHALSLDDVEIENLVPEALRNVPLQEFLTRIGEMDDVMTQRLAAARAQGGELRYLARLQPDGLAQVGLSIPAAGHAALHGRLTDNLIQFQTRRYADNPLVVQGPGAGAEVTASAVFSDILAIGRTLGGQA